MNTTARKVIEIAYHRNGIAGDGFYVARIRDPELKNTLVGIVPAWAVGDADKPAKSSPEGFKPCYVIDPTIAAEGGIAFGVNSWRGDNYFDLIVEAAREYEASFETIPAVAP